MKVYAVRNWNDLFEKSQTRKCDKMQWVAIPVKHDGKGYRRVMRSPNGPQVYAAWILILQVAAKCPTRGILVDPDGPLTAEDLELKTDCPAEWFEQAFQVLTDPKVAWLTTSELPANYQPGGTTETEQDRQDRTGQNSNGQITEDTTSAPDDAPERSDPICFSDQQMQRSQQRAATLFRKCNYAGKDGALLWKAAALVESGNLPEWIPVDAVQAAACNAKRNPIGFVRQVMLDNGKKSKIDVGLLLKRAKLPSGWSTGPPAAGYASASIASNLDPPK